VRQGRTDAWIAHQLEVSAKDISGFKREHDLAPGEETAGAETDLFGPRIDEDEPDLRAEDEAAVAAALEAEQDEPDEEEDDPGDDEQDSDGDSDDSGASDANGEGDGDGSGQRRRRRGRRGGRGRGRQRKALEGTFDHGEEGYGLWLDPGVQDDPLYAEHWRGHRPVTVTIEADRIVIERSGESSDAD